MTDVGIANGKGNGRESRFTPVVYDQIRNLVGRGKSTEEIAEIIGCAAATLKVMCSKAKVSLRRPVSSEFRPIHRLVATQPSTAQLSEATTSEDTSGGKGRPASSDEPLNDLEERLEYNIAKQEAVLAALRNQLIGVQLARKAIK